MLNYCIRPAPRQSNALESENPTEACFSWLFGPPCLCWKDGLDPRCSQPTVLPHPHALQTERGREKMKFKELTSWLLMLSILLCGFEAVQADEADKASTDDVAAEEAEALDLFQAIDDGLVDVKFVARSDSKGRLVMTNKTDEPIDVQIPEAFAGVPVLPQFGGGGGGFGGGGGGFGGGGGGGNQSVGGGGGGGRRGGGGGGRFNIQPEKVSRVDVPLVCLDHGLKDPSSSKPYEIRPIEDVVDSLAIVEIVKAFANGELPRGATQAAVWHINSEVSWIDLANKLTGTKRQIVRDPYFSSGEIRMAIAIASQAEAITAGKTIERRNWKSPSQKQADEEPVYDGYTPETEESEAEVNDPGPKTDSVL